MVVGKHFTCLLVVVWEVLTYLLNSILVDALPTSTM